MTGITRSVTLIMGLVVVLATTACGRRAVNMRPNGNGPDGGDGSNPGGESVRGDAGTSDGPDYPPCPLPFAAGSDCAIESLACAPPPECRRCVGGFRLMPRPATYPCICRAGRWTCLPPSPIGPVGDCFIDEPLSCDEARDVYRDPGCTEPAPCSP